MSIPHADRTITHVERTVVAASPAIVFGELTALADLVAASDAIRIESWPEDGLCVPDTAFWAVHWAAPSSGHAVEYNLAAIAAPTSIELTAHSDLYYASHRVVVAPATGGGTEIAWAVTLDPDRPATRQLVEDAALPATIALGRLDLLDVVGPADDVIDLAVDEVVIDLTADSADDPRPDDRAVAQS